MTTFAIWDMILSKPEYATYTEAYLPPTFDYLGIKLVEDKLPKLLGKYPVVTETYMRENEIHFRANGVLVGKIINLEVEK